jgi:hypothetical protein
MVSTSWPPPYPAEHRSTYALLEQKTSEGIVHAHRRSFSESSFEHTLVQIQDKYPLWVLAAS